MLWHYDNHDLVNHHKIVLTDEQETSLYRQLLMKIMKQHMSVVKIFQIHDESHIILFQSPFFVDKF